MKIGINIANMPGVDTDEPGVCFIFEDVDESTPNVALAERAARHAVKKHGLTPGRCYMWRAEDESGVKRGGGMVAVAIAVTACEFPRDVMGG